MPVRAMLRQHVVSHAGDLLTLDGSDLGDHMEVVTAVHALAEFTTMSLLERIVRCAAEVLLQTAPRLLEVRVLQLMASR